MKGLVSAIDIRPHVVKGRLTIGGLLHLHGFMWTERFFTYDELHKIISEVWGEVHDSPVVYIRDIYSDEGAKKYNIKHVVKDYLDDTVSGRRMLCSKGWLPVGWKQVMKIVVSWYLEVKYPNWVKTLEEMDEYEVNNPIQAKNCVYLAKEIMDDLIKRWCKGEGIRLEFPDRTVFIQGIECYEKMKE